MRVNARYSLFVCTVCFLFLPAVTVHAQWGQDGIPICAVAGNQYPNDIISDGAGGAIITWQDYRGGNWDIYAQKVDANGNALWTANGVVVCAAAGSQNSPIVILDGAGGAIIAWDDQRVGAYPNIYAQRVSAAGNCVWTANGVAICTAVYDQWCGGIVSDGTGGAIITWSDFRTGSDSGIYAQRITGIGSVVWTTNGVPVRVTTGYGDSPVLSSDGAGGAIIAWEDSRGVYGSIYAQRINSSGSRLWTANGVAVSASDGLQWFLDIASDNAGGAVIAWSDCRNCGSWDIYAQRVNSGGSRLWITNGVAVCTVAGEKMFPQITADGANSAIITWEDERSVSSYDIYAQRVDGGGSLRWTTGGIGLCTSAGDQRYPKLVSDGAGGAVVAWYDFRGNGNSDIYAQRINVDGNMLWTPDGLVVSEAIGDQSYPLIASDGAGGAIVVWRDYRSGTDCDMYANRILGSGCITEPDPPSCLTAGAVSSSEVQLSWQDNSSDEASVQVWRKTGVEGAWAAAVSLPANSTSWSNTGLTSCTTYFYRVRACNESGCSDWSNTASAMASGLCPDLVVDPDRIEVAQAVVSPNLVQGKKTVVRVFLENAGEPFGSACLVTGKLHVLDENGSPLGVYDEDAPIVWNTDNLFDNTTIHEGRNSLNFYLEQGIISHPELRFWIEIHTDNPEENETNNSTEANPIAQSFKAPAKLSIGYCDVSSDFEQFNTPKMGTAYELIANTFPVVFENSADWVYLKHIPWTAPLGSLKWDGFARIRLGKELFLTNLYRRIHSLPQLHCIVGFFKDWPYPGVLGKSSMNADEIMIDADIVAERCVERDYYRQTVPSLPT